MQRSRRHRPDAPSLPEGDTELGLGFYILLIVVAMVFIASVIESFRATGYLSLAAIALAVVTGLYLAWFAMSVLFGRFVIAVVTRAVERAKDSPDR